MIRKKIIVGNWKMNNTIKQGIEFIQNIKGKIDVNSVDVAICPTYIALESMCKVLKDSNIKVGAQNVHFESKGAYTGEVSLEMLKELGIEYCIIGHSERREYFNETDETVNLKLKRICTDSDIIPIVCVGEKLADRKANIHLDLVKTQVTKAFQNIKEDKAKDCVIAYEPIWAIGTGETATAKEAEEMCAYIRSVICDMYDDVVAGSIRIQYGGSVNGTNAKELLNMPNIDGALVGGASLKEDFINIVNYNIV